MKVEDKLGLGTVQFGIPYGISNNTGKTTASEVSKILEFARSQNLQIIDTASAYGSSQQVLGSNDLSNFKIVSKYMPPETDGEIETQFYKTLQQLGVEKLYGYLAHRPLNILKAPAQWEALNELKIKGKIKKIGYSLNEPKELEKLLDAGFFPDLVQAPYNFFDRRFESYFIELFKKNCEIHTRSVFLQGIFFINPNNLDPYFSEIVPILKKIRKSSDNLAGSLLKFVLEKPFIDHVIMGVNTLEQLKQNFKGIKNAPGLPDEKTSISDNILIPSRWPTK